ncbi:MAG: hypothetical protein CMC23_05460 [Flavobacteriaceae bacterium]|nr:hypothetical protein [Flavobacteriaceae bacterium]|tara:strand:- start:20287 stop:21246 length:960 start_codon:yes stop_codon:yes gene_type:complete
MNKNNFLYCFDENYNKQALISIISLLDNLKEKINIYIIHNRPETIINQLETIKNNKFIDNVDVFQYENSNIELPNLNNSHVSEATYFRLFIENYLPEDIEEIVYIDADIICMSNPLIKINETFTEMKNKNMYIGALTEFMKNEYSKSHFERLSLKSKNYFNAGVLLINFKFWKNNNLQNKFLKLIENHRKVIKFWDQDILNSYFDGSYFELDSSLNYKVNLTKKDYSNNFTKDELDNAIFLHYAGSFKPWTVRGAYHKKSQFYHDYFLQVFNKYYHIENTWRRAALFELIKSVISFKILNARYPFKLLIYSLKSIFQNK